MKRIFLSLLALLSAVSFSQAQQAIPQGGLENWAARGSATLAPTGWLTTDDVLAANGIPFPANAVRRNATPYAGTYAAQLVTASLFGLGSVPGALIIGNVAKESPLYDLPGVPYTSRGARLEFYYKLTGNNVTTDSAGVQIQLTRTSNNQAEIVAGATQFLVQPASNYTLMSVPLKYLTASQPDTIRLAFFSASADNPTANGVTFIVDDVRLVGTVAATRDAAADAALSLYPTSSADGQFTLAATTRPELLRGALSVSDATGRVVLRQPAATGTPAIRSLDLRGQAAGVYIVRLETANGPLTRRLMML